MPVTNTPVNPSDRELTVFDVAGADRTTSAYGQMSGSSGRSYPWRTGCPVSAGGPSGLGFAHPCRPPVCHGTCPCAAAGGTGLAQTGVMTRLAVPLMASRPVVAQAVRLSWGWTTTLVTELPCPYPEVMEPTAVATVVPLAARTTVVLG